MNEILLRNLLREWISEEYVVTELCEFEDELDPFGRPVPHRDIYRAINESRLAGLQRVAPDRTDLHDVQRAVLTALSAIPAHERLNYWFARSSTHEYSGVACARGIISFCAVTSSPDDRNGDL